MYYIKVVFLEHLPFLMEFIALYVLRNDYEVFQKYDYSAFF